MPTTTNFIWDEQNHLAESDATNTINLVYTNEPQQFGNLVSSRISGTTWYHHFDALGSTRQLTTLAGSTTDTVVYDAWGNVVSRNGSTGVRLLWIGALGYYFDQDTTLYSLRRRVYIPTLARWQSPDPVRLIGAVAGRRRSGSFPFPTRTIHIALREALLGPYVYVSNLPIDRSDPTGLYTVIYKAGRGVFNIATIHDACTWEIPNWRLFNIVQLTDVGSFVTLSWRPYDPSFGDPSNPFQRPDCCLCDQIAYVQVITTTKATGWWWWGSTAPTPWHVDNGIPYPIGQFGAPCGPPIGTFAVLNDDAGGSTSRLYDLDQEAEACVICLSGREGVITNYPQLYVYGCVTWSHAFTAESALDQFKVFRQIGPRSRTGRLFDYDQNQSDIINLDYIGGTGLPPTPGAPPSARFLSVLATYTTFPTNTPSAGNA